MIWRKVLNRESRKIGDDSLVRLGLIATTSCSRTHADPQQFSGPMVDVPHFAGSSRESPLPDLGECHRLYINYPVEHEIHTVVDCS